MRTREEYSNLIPLESNKGNYMVIPGSIILDKEANDKRTTAFSYIRTWCGLNNKLLLTINNLVEWTGRKPDRHKNGANNKFIQAMEYLSDNDYICISEDLSELSLSKASSALLEIELNTSKISEECREYRFATVYLDELDRIISYENPNPKDSFFNKDIVLLVFSYLRMMIPRRKNKLLPDENGSISDRKERYPEAYDCYHADIAEELGLSQKAVSKAIDALKKLGLIYHEELPRIKTDDNWKTQPTIFCNFYKREEKNLLAEGREYYMEEIKNKKKKLNALFLKKSA